MKKLVIAVAIAVIGVLVWKHQATGLRSVDVQNSRLAAAVAELEARAAAAKSKSDAAEQRLAAIRSESLRTPIAKTGGDPREIADTHAPPDPDPSRNGGWPAGASFMYLPKQYLTNASFRLFEGGRLTDEAAALYGMSPGERDATEKAFDYLVEEFHKIEISKMAAVDPPAGWGPLANSDTPSAMHFDSALTYQIPDLTQDINAARAGFADQLQQALGQSRAQMLSSAASSYLADNLNDLGSGDRIVGFMWEPESDGTHSLWYAQAGGGAGQGSFQLVQPDLDPNSQIAYYARLFGVPLPQKSQ